MEMSGNAIRVILYQGDVSLGVVDDEHVRILFLHPVWGFRMNENAFLHSRMMCD